MDAGAVAAAAPSAAAVIQTNEGRQAASQPRAFERINDAFSESAPLKDASVGQR